MKKAIFLVLAIVLPIFASAQVVINEVGWAGTKASANDEWLELMNYGNTEINLDGWSIKAKDGAPQINLNGAIPAYGFYLIERTSDTTISDIVADYFGSFGKYGSLSNSGEDLELIDSQGIIKDKAYFSSGWPAGESGPNYKSMERIDPQKDGSNGSNWQSNDGVKINGKDANGNIILGTPRQENSVFKNGVVDSVSQTSQNLEENKNSSLNQIKEPEAYNNTNYYSSFNKKTIQAFAGGNRIAVSGADIDFKGEAMGLKNEPLTENTRFVWSFGDGSYKEGKNVSHVYFFPGEYITTLDVVSGEYESSDRAFIKVVPNKVKISEISPFNSWIEFSNDSNEIIDISFWILESESKRFIFPRNTFIRPKTFLVVPFQVSFLNLNKTGGEVRFLYPNGFLADSFAYGESVLGSESFSIIGGIVEKSVETPGEENKSAAQTFINAANRNYNKKNILAINSSGIFKISSSSTVKPSSLLKRNIYSHSIEKNAINVADGEYLQEKNSDSYKSGDSKQEIDSSKAELDNKQESAVLISSSFKFSKLFWLAVVFLASVVITAVLFLLKKV